SRDECKGIDTNPVYEKERNGWDVQRLNTALECLESRTDIFGSPDFKHVGFERESMCRSVDLVYFVGGVRITHVGQHRQTAQTGDDLTQQFYPLASRIRCLARQAGDIATRSGQTCDNAGADWIARRREYDRDH